MFTLTGCIWTVQTSRPATEIQSHSGSGAAVSDELVIRAFRAFTVTDTVSKASGGTFAGEITATSFQTTNTTVDTAAFRTNDQTVTENTTIGSTKNAMAVGPLTINSSVTLTCQRQPDNPVRRRWLLF